MPLGDAIWPPVGLISGLASLQRHEATTDIAYAEGARGRLDLYRPRGKGIAPVIVFFYGGSWQSGAKKMYRFLGAALAARGFVVIIPDYRVYPEVKFPDFLVDGAKALAWVRAHVAAYRGDAGQIFVMGHSAGAYIGAMLAFDDAWLGQVGLDPARVIAGLIGLSGPYDFLPLRDPVLKEIFGGDDRPSTQPIFFANAGKPPALLLSGKGDDVVAPGNSVRLAEKLRRHGNDATAILYRGFGHLTILAGFAPLVATHLAPWRDVEAFVRRAGSGAARRGAILPGAPS